MRPTRNKAPRRPFLHAILRAFLFGSLLTCISPATPVQGQYETGQSFERLFQQAYDALVGGRADESIAAFKRCLELEPMDIQSAYNLARAYTLKGELDLALEWLARAVDYGYEELDHLKQDPKLRSLSNDPRFEALLARLRRRGRADSTRVEDRDPERTFDLVVMIEGQLGDVPTVGAGIIFGRKGERMFIATANRVVRRDTMVARQLGVRLRSLPDTLLKARLMEQFDPVLDLAVLSVEEINRNGIDFCALPLQRLGRVDTLKPGAPVLPVGYANAARWSAPIAPDRLAKIVGEQIEFHSNFIGPGHSGGALLTGRGDLIGMIRKDTPPYGVATDLMRVLEVLQASGYPVQLRSPAPNGRTPLHQAIQQRDLEALERLSSDCVYLLAPDDDGWTPLHRAAAQGWVEGVERLIDAGADVNGVTEEPPHYLDIRQRTPLHLAAASGSAAVVGMLLAKGARVDVKAVDPMGRVWEGTPLHEAAANGFAAVVEILLEHGAYVDAYSSEGTPLAYAVRQGHADVAKLLLTHGANVNPDTRIQNPLLLAIERGAGDLVQMLVTKGADVNRVLLFVADRRNADAIQVLLKNGADVNVRDEYGETPLRMAARSGDQDAVRLLLEHGAEVNTFDRETPLHAAASFGRAGVIRLLLAAGAAADAKDKSGYTPLHRATIHEEVEAVVALLQAGARVDEVDLDGGRTPLHEAALRGYVEVLQHLLEAGAPIHAVDSDGSTPLFSAVATEQVEAVHLLIAAGSDVNRAGVDRFTPLHQSVWNFPSQRRQAEIAQALLAAGADVDAKDEFGYTPLHRAVMTGERESVQPLLAAGADVDARDEEGQTPLHGAILLSSGAEAIAELLIEHGADVNAKNLQDETPLAIAVRIGSAAERLLRMHGGRQ